MATQALALGESREFSEGSLLGPPRLFQHLTGLRNASSIEKNCRNHFPLKTMALGPERPRRHKAMSQLSRAGARTCPHERGMKLPRGSSLDGVLLTHWSSGIGSFREERAELLSISQYRSEEGAFTNESWIHFQPGLSQILSFPTLCLIHFSTSALWPPHQEGFCTVLGLAQALLRARRREGKCCHVAPVSGRLAKRQQSQGLQGWVVSRGCRPRREAPRAVSRYAQSQGFQSRVLQGQCWLPRGKPPAGYRQSAGPVPAAAPPYLWLHSGPGMKQRWVRREPAVFPNSHLCHPWNELFFGYPGEHWGLSSQKWPLGPLVNSLPHL